MKQGEYLFTRAKTKARLNAQRCGCPWYVVRSMRGFVPCESADILQECWEVSPNGTLTHIEQGRRTITLIHPMG